MRSNPVRLLWFWLTLLPGVGLAQTNLPPDQWITNAVLYPPGTATELICSNAFATLHADSLAGRLKILWTPDTPNPGARVTVHASADALGHWPARDWRSYPMVLRGASWQATVPVDDVDVPLAYFVTVEEHAASNAPAGHPSAAGPEVPLAPRGTSGERGSFKNPQRTSGLPPRASLSPMRLCRPRAAGLEEPSRIFWSFLEGFEQDMESWRLLTTDAGAPPLKTDPAAHNGHAALAVTLPAGKHSVTVATTRVRGWQLSQRGATSLRLWLRTREGAARVQFTLLAQAFTTNQVVAIWPRDIQLTAQWQQVDLPFGLVPQVPLAAVDLFAIEFIGEGPREFLVDDLQLLGPWGLEAD